jgi:hypothetical protein
MGYLDHSIDLIDLSYIVSLIKLDKLSHAIACTYVFHVGERIYGFFFFSFERLFSFQNMNRLIILFH